jgi:uncharacterized protein (DUF433 family)
MNEYEALLGRITIDPNVLVGKPCIRGMRISVEHILEALAAGNSQKELLAEYPVLDPEDIAAALLYARELVATERVYPMSQRG